MPYTTNTLSYLAGGPVEGAWKLWEYTTTDAISTVLGSGYVADATIKAMAVGDFVIVVNQTNPQGYILQVQSVTAASGNIPGAATLVVPAGVNAPNPAFPRNLIDGGDFTTNPWQRGTSFTGINNATSPVVYTADRWFAYSNNASASISVSQVTGITAIPAFSQGLQIGRASGNAITTPFSLGQVIETPDSIRAQGQQVTLSFWAVAGANWSPANGALNVLIATGTGTNQSAGSLLAGTWTNYSSLVVTPQQGTSGAAANVAQPITTTWTRYAIQCNDSVECLADRHSDQRHAGRYRRVRRLRADHGGPARTGAAGNAVRAPGCRNGTGHLPALFLQHSGTRVRCRRGSRHDRGGQCGDHLHSAAGANV